MGNSGAKKISLKYLGRKEVIFGQINSFRNFSDAVKDLFGIERTTPITLRLGENYVSSEYNWEKIRGMDELVLEVWQQVEKPISENEILAPFLEHIFKIQNRKEKVVGMGFFISQNICIVPKSLIKLDDLEKFTSKYILKFLDESETQFSLNNVYHILGDHSSNQCFVLFEVNRFVEEFQISYPKTRKDLKFQTLHFNSKCQMISTIRYTHIEIDSKTNFKLKDFNSENSFLPGAVLISDSQEVLGMYQGGIGQLFTPMRVIFDHISHLLEESIKIKDFRTRNLLLELSNMEIYFPEIDVILKCMNQLRFPSVEVYNPLPIQ